MDFESERVMEMMEVLKEVSLPLKGENKKEFEYQNPLDLLSFGDLLEKVFVLKVK